MQALAREVKLWANFNHPNIMPLIGFYLQEKHKIAWMISEWEAYGDVTKYLADQNPDQRIRLQLVCSVS